MPQGELAHVLRGVTDTVDERLLVGPATLDDAGVVLLGEGQGVPGAGVALVQTVDFFPPVVDDPFTYGAIAAANSLSDVYAMGGKPFTALALAGFPKDFPPEWRSEILRGGYEKIRESGAILAGGHTVQSEALFGYSVTGLVDPERVSTNAGARAGDVAYLTKPIGMGCVTTAAKLGKAEADVVDAAMRQMMLLNDRAAEVLREVDVRACTDITGFGLVGHALNIARASGLRLRIHSEAVPLAMGARELAERKLFSGGAARSMKALADAVDIGAGLPEAMVGLLFDAETSGGLLLVVPEGAAERLEAALVRRDLPVHRVGEFFASEHPGIDLV